MIRALRPLATSVTAVLPDGSRHPMTHLHLGVFEVTVPGKPNPFGIIALRSPTSTATRSGKTTRTGTCRRLASSTCT